ncbi:ATP-dependent Clp protease adaptor protein ClpS [Lentzea waywayandensis]|uniref:ATP-dependent Clp protease adaptor protein ClpS n=1 Tax=Lentzea waywayandensis TaxID=84724 RepID=A0A1I6CV88_9PSEU|nr:ATP-dependent Clp protease adaptor protein ClpS [Lentzea waywayandensis]
MHNDDINTFALVHYVLRTVCGHDDARARAKTMEIHLSGRSVLGDYDRASAEAMALRLVRLGVRATADGAR